MTEEELRTLADDWFSNTYGPTQISGITMCGKAFKAGYHSRHEEFLRMEDAWRNKVAELYHKIYLLTEELNEALK